MNIFIDMDGVLCDLNRITITQEQWDTDSTICLYKEPTTLVHFFNVYEEQLKSHNVTILTNIPDCKLFKTHCECKRKWLKSHLDFKYKVKFNKEGKPKSKYIIETGDILVDDSLSNLDDWQKGGGTAIHVSTLLTNRGEALFSKLLRFNV
ncbi:MAG: hypothetical protein HUJ52_03210 [Malacoplasma sp.]|nr:hypothetical protein [Malacoplasma sp.]